MNSKTRYLPAALLIVFGVYAFFLSNNWAWDDVSLIQKNTELRAFSNISKLFSKEYFAISKEPSYRPLSIFLYLATFKIFGQSPFYFHLSSLILHLLTTAGIYFIVLGLTGSPFAAFAASLIFGLHPVNTEAVFCASYNKDLMATLGIVWLFVLRIGRSYKEWKPLTFLAAALLYLMCLFSKETGLTFILLLLVYDFIFNKTEMISRNAMMFYGLLLALTMLYFSVRFRFIVAPQSAGKYFGGTLFNNMLNIPIIMLNYFRLFIVPMPLSVEHVMKAATGFSFNVILVASIFISICAMFFIFVRNNKIFLFSFLWILISLAPVMNFIPFLHRTFWAERYMYLGSAGFSIATAYLFVKQFCLDNKFQRLAKGCLVLMLAGYASMVFARGMNWNNAKSLYLNDLKVSPDGFGLNCLIADAYADENNHIQAIKYYEKILAAEPASIFKDQVTAYLNLSRLYIVTNSNLNAVRIAEQGLAVLPEERAELLSNLAVAKFNLGYYEEAAKLDKKALLLSDIPEIRYSLGFCYYKAGSIGLAEESFERVKSKLPLYIDLFKTLKVIYAKNGDKGKAKEIELEIQKIEKNPNRISGMPLFSGE